MFLFTSISSSGVRKDGRSRCVFLQDIIYSRHSEVTHLWPSALLNTLSHSNIVLSKCCQFYKLEDNQYELFTETKKFICLIFNWCSVTWNIINISLFGKSEWKFHHFINYISIFLGRVGLCSSTLVVGYCT